MHFSINCDDIKKASISQGKQEDPIKIAISEAIKTSCTIIINLNDKKWTGSGFHIGNGYIASVAHVATEELINNDKANIVITFDGINKLQASVIMSNDADDTAILFCQEAKDNPFIELGDSNSIEVGDIIAAIGSPEGWHDTATVGRVTNKNQNLGQYAPSPAWNDMIFIDADILEGSSGGEVIATDGKVYGIVMGVTGYNAEIGVGQNSVIPINKLKSLLNMTQK